VVELVFPLSTGSIAVGQGLVFLGIAHPNKAGVDYFASCLDNSLPAL